LRKGVGREDVVLFTVDSMGTNYLEIAGWPPVMASLRDEGLFYSRCHSVVPSTHMSVQEMLAGLGPHPANGPNVHFLGYASSAGVERVTRMFSDQGYYTACVIPWAEHAPDMSYGFAHTEGVLRVPDRTVNLAPIVRQIATTKKPVFLWVHTFPFYGLGGHVRLNTREEAAKGLTESLAYSDRLLGDVLSLFPGCRIILAADHGDGIDDGATGHGFELSPSCLRVPLVVRDGVRRGVVDDLVSLARAREELLGALGDVPPIRRGPIWIRTFFPLQGGGEVGAIANCGMVRAFLPGDRGLYLRDPEHFEKRIEPLGWAYYPRWSAPLEALGEIVLTREKWLRKESVRMRE
jgi:hypothetical protein